MGRHAEAARNDRRLLDAAREIFATQGYDAPVAAVAAAAGIGMGSLYRRFATKDDLLADLCLRSMQEMTAAAAEARASDHDPWVRLTAFIRICVAARCGAFAPVAGRIPVSTTMISEAHGSQQAASALLSDAQAAGCVRSDVTVVDLLRLIELFSRSSRASTDIPSAQPEARPAQFEPRSAHAGASSTHVETHMQRRLLELALAGLRAVDAQPLPRPAPTLDAYRARWISATRHTA